MKSLKKTLILEDLNSKSLYELFSSLYKEKHGYEYEGAGFIGNEMHKLKVVLEDYGPENIACAILNCIKRNDRTVSVPYFTAGIKYYLVPDYPDIYWAVKRYGTPEIKKLWNSLIVLDAIWLPSASQKKELKQIKGKLQEWTNAQTKKSSRKTNTKTKKTAKIRKKS